MVVSLHAPISVGRSSALACCHLAGKSAKQARIARRKMKLGIVSPPHAAQEFMIRGTMMIEERFA
jgi:hypothetical protein